MRVERWALLEPFLPTSSKQVLEYIRFRGYPVPTDRKTRRPTTSEEGLTKLHSEVAPSDTVLPKIIECRKLVKALGYLDDTFLGRDGRMHPQFTFLPDTGRLSSRAPNFQNIPQGHDGGIDKEVALAIRRAVIPSPGCTLLELDWKAIEALLVGYFAGDDDYIRVSKMDPHSYLASHIIGKPADLSWDDAKLSAYFKEIKETHPGVRALAKKNNYAGNYDQSAKNRARDIGCTVEEAITYMKVMDAIAPKVRAWKQTTRMRAHIEGRLMNPFGYVRAFFNVFEKKRDGNWRLGPEAWEALAFLPQSTCAGMCRETVLAVADLPGYGEWFWLLVPIHDSLLLEVREEKVDEVRVTIQGLMEKEWEELGGLRVEVESKVGKNWGEMH